MYRETVRGVCAAAPLLTPLLPPLAGWLACVRCGTMAVLKSVVGSVALMHSEEVEELGLEALRQLHGDLRLVDNPALHTVRVHSQLAVAGCLQVAGCPKLQLPPLLQRLPRCTRGTAAAGPYGGH
jgi:hypothetical protein